MKAIETKIFHGEIHQHFRERNLTDRDEKENYINKKKSENKQKKKKKRNCQS